MDLSFILNAVQRLRAHYVWIRPVAYPIIQKDPDDWVQKCMDYEVDGKRSRGRPEKTLKDLREKDMVARGLSWGDAIDRERRREGVRGSKWPTPA